MKLAAAAALLVAGSSLAHAEAIDPVRDRATAAEKTVLDELDKETYVKARTDAENILDSNPNSFIAVWAMARIQHDEEGNHARALFYVRKAESLLAQNFGQPASWDRKLLMEEYSINEEMDRSADALEVLDRYDARYGHGMEHLRIWPTFKLGRMDEARAIGRKLAASDDAEERELAYNGMLALEFEAHDRDASYKWAMDGVAVTQGRSCIILRNASGVSYIKFKLREAEDLGLKAHEAADQSCDGAGYDQLAGLYLVMGEFNKAVAALKSLKATPIPKRYRPHFALERRALLSDIMYALGKVNDAERLAAEVYGLPERIGMTSGGKRVTDFVRSFRYWMTLDAKIMLDTEHASYRPLLSAMSSEDLMLGFTRWTIRRDLIQLAADNVFLTNLTRPNMGELYQHGSWHTMELIGVLGTGVMRDAVAAARRADAKEPGATPYLDLFDAEIEYRRGNYIKAAAQATAALDKLPKEEAMLRWRTLAWQANALRLAGEPVSFYTPLYHEVLEKAPSLLRIVDTAIPVSVTTDGGARSVEAASRVVRSPRFTSMANAPFRIAISEKGGIVQLCLTDASGFSYSCAAGDKDKKDNAEDAIISALDAFHDAAFSPKVSLDQADLNSLDGSPTRASADQVLKGLIEP